MLLIDTYNVLHAIEGLGPDAAELTVDSLGRLIASSRHRGEACLLICDGNQGVSGEIEGASGVQRRYVGAGRDADSEIERILASNSAPRRILVVSSDHRLRRAAEKRKAKWMDSPSFLARILGDAEVRRGRSGGLSPRTSGRSCGPSVSSRPRSSAVENGTRGPGRAMKRSTRRCATSVSVWTRTILTWTGGSAEKKSEPDPTRSTDGR